MVKFYLTNGESISLSDYDVIYYKDKSTLAKDVDYPKLMNSDNTLLELRKERTIIYTFSKSVVSIKLSDSSRVANSQLGI